MTIGNKLRMLRIENHYTLKDLSRKIKIGYSTLSNYERDYRTPYVDTISKIAKFYGISVDYLIGYEYEDDLAFKREIFLSKKIVLPVIEQRNINHEGDKYFLDKDIVNTVAVDNFSNALFGIKITNENWNPEIENGDIVLTAREEIDTSKYYFCFFINTKTIGKIQRIKNGYLIYNEKDVSSSTFIADLNGDYLSDKILKITGIVKGIKTPF